MKRQRKTHPVFNPAAVVSPGNHVMSLPIQVGGDFIAVLFGSAVTNRRSMGARGSAPQWTNPLATSPNIKTL